MITLTCIYCSDDFKAMRSSAKYCCDSHKTLDCRRRKKQAVIDQERQQIQNEIDKLRREIEDNRIMWKKKFDDANAEHIRQTEVDNEAREKKQHRDKIDALLQRGKRLIDDGKKETEKLNAGMELLKLLTANILAEATRKSDNVEKSQIETDDPTTEKTETPDMTDDSCIPNPMETEQDQIQSPPDDLPEDPKNQ